MGFFFAAAVLFYEIVLWKTSHTRPVISYHTFICNNNNKDLTLLLISGLPNDVTTLTCDDDHCILIGNFFSFLYLRRLLLQIFVHHRIFNKIATNSFMLMLRLNFWLKSKMTFARRNNNKLLYNSLWLTRKSSIKLQFFNKIFFSFKCSWKRKLLMTAT